MNVPAGKIPLKYQSTEYDCVPTTFLNALNYLFRRDEIPPEVIQRILLYSLDTINSKGENGKLGTSGLASKFIVQWLNQYSSQSKNFFVECNYFTDNELNLNQNNKLIRCVNEGGVALCRVCTDQTGSNYHYILCTKADANYLYFFDPYFRKNQFRKPDNDYFEWIEDKWEYNLKVSRERINSNIFEKNSFGPTEYREFCTIKRIDK